jgi:O-methyltransferase involved in polyketide biosynthesis
VAAHRVGFARVATDYGDPTADEALSADVAAGQVAPANRMHDDLAARTSFFDRTVVGAIDRGVRQVAAGAAGYDGRPARLSPPPGHPAALPDGPAPRRLPRRQLIRRVV